VHRFGISFHRNKRSKGTFKNELEDIPGIGKATADILLKEFKSVKNVREAKHQEIELKIGKSKALIIANYFSSK
jgi:excinuclease ABC subunit C